MPPGERRCLLTALIILFQNKEDISESYALPSTDSDDIRLEENNTEIREENGSAGNILPSSPDPTILVTHTDLGPQKFTCEVCGKIFDKKRYLQIHLKRHQDSNKKFRCQICGWHFFERHKLKSHLETHKPSELRQLPYKCDICDRQFHNKAGWSDHMNAHSGTRAWKCKVCEATFTYRGALKRHSQVHKGKQFQCNTCSKAFALKSNLDSHMSIHTGVTSHVCPCGKAYTVGASLKRHKENCKETGKPSIARDQTANHVDMIYVCGLCSKAYQSVEEVERHAKLH